ncbi:MAG: hypothetical protein QXJ17_01105 [Nitrososphaeria archaeon]
MAKSWFVTPLYLSGAWTLMITYQVFTQTALSTVLNEINYYWPSIGALLISRIDTIVFIYAFTWVFVISSAMPSVVLGRQKSVILQFFVVMSLTILTLSAPEIVKIYFDFDVKNLFNFTTFLQNPYFAILYLSAPYLILFEIDILGTGEEKSKAKNKK